MKIEDLKDHLNKARIHLKDELSKVRSGKANASIIDEVRVEAYAGTEAMAVKEVATVTIPDSQSILINPWDKSLLRKIEDAIRNSGLGLNPINEGSQIRVPVPSLTEERRMEMVKHVSQIVEQSKISVRTVRQNAIKAAEEMEDNGVITEDDLFRIKKEIEDLVSSANKDLDALGEDKKEELLKI
jgi:ribosome recycling factor